jgi:hypothetical protein
MAEKLEYTLKKESILAYKDKETIKVVKEKRADLLSVEEQLRAKWKKENSGLTDANIDYYIKTFNKYKANPKIKDKNIANYKFKELESLIDSSFSREIEYHDIQDKPVIDNKEMSAYIGSSKDRCILYGKGEKWCTSREDSANMFYSYRYGANKTLYFVLDKTRKEDDDRKKAIILVDSQGKFSLADRTNSGEFSGSTPMSWERIEQELPSVKGLKDKFKFIPLSKDEQEKYDKVKHRIGGSFKQNKFSREDIEMYISIGQKLTTAQFGELDKELRNKYLNTGRKVDQEVFDKLTPSEIQVYFKINMQVNNDDLDLGSLESLPEGIKFPENCKRINLSNFKSLTD